MNRLSLLFSFTCIFCIGFYTPVLAQDAVASSQDSTLAAYLARALQHHSDAFPIIDPTATYSLVLEIQTPYSEVYGHYFGIPIDVIKSKGSHYVSPADSIAVDLTEFIRLYGPSWIFIGDDFHARSLGKGQYIIVENRYTFQHGEQTSWGMKTTSYYEAVSGE